MKVVLLILVQYFLIACILVKFILVFDIFYNKIVN